MEARILFYDLEVTPMLCWAYDRFDANVIHVEHESHIMCFAYKWLGESKVHVVALPDFPTYKNDTWDDGELVKRLWSLLDEADVVVAHNANKFDNRVATERFLTHRLGPPSPYKTVDTLTVARRYFKNSSNSLNNLCSKLGIGEKPADTHARLWHSCVNGDEQAWRKMVRYCKHDVELLESLYLTLRPYMANHPNVALLSGKLDGCPKCGSSAIQLRGLQRSLTATYRRVQCTDCGAWSRVRLAEAVEKPKHVNI